MFQWNWDSVAAECTNFIGPAGYGYVQLSPAMEHVQGTEWWTDYQVVSYQISSKHGTRSQFQSMINTCHAAGVQVLVDTIWNHMTSGSGTGTGGSSYTQYNYPGTYMVYDFHDIYAGISDWGNLTQLQFFQLFGLADLKTESDYVRSRLAQFGSDLISLGVDGFRLDAAKHMPVADLKSIVSQLNTQGRNIFITQEVIKGDAQQLHPSDYLAIGKVAYRRHRFALRDDIRDVFMTGVRKLSDFQNLDNKGYLPSAQANTFVTNHDSERYTNQLSFTRSPHNGYVLANVFLLAHPYGQPSIISSYQYSNDDAGAPNNGYGTCDGTGGTNGWVCQHRWVAFQGMVAWRNRVAGAAMNNWVAGSSMKIAFGRGSNGFVGINNEDKDWTTTFTTALPDGVYCDVIGGLFSNGQCSGYWKFTVKGGKFQGTVPARGAVAIHTGAKLS
ncbi:glycoside hydrolase family 13 protein [Epithele typhae]|uniref:glycoside hydrolase family 13 protein n=1 Tax=Epithele typhae TaxID=378194 RepID=UPI002008819E|nr:glycoside hydrolase family 13 protein [Epithele typhae]KAH9923707.1 glycoside hydrolase family 13 protein [Epithele typhae]